MSATIDETADRCGRLIRYGLEVRLSPASDVEYLQLVREFLSDADFQKIALAFAQGLGLRILNVSTQSGVTLGTTAESPFQLQRDDYHSRMSGADRIVQGIIHLAIAAWCFPKAEDLREPDEVLPARITVEQLVDYIHNLCEDIKNRKEHRTDSNSELRTGSQFVLALGKYADSADGRNSFTTLAGKVRFALNFLTNHGLLKREGPDNGPSWLARPRFRIHVREFAGHEAFRLVMGTAQDVPRG